MNIVTMKIANGGFTYYGVHYEYCRVDLDSTLFYPEFSDDITFQTRVLRKDPLTDDNLSVLKNRIKEGTIIVVDSYTDNELINLSQCSHEYVNVGFTSITLACKHCGKDK